LNTSVNVASASLRVGSGGMGAPSRCRSWTSSGTCPGVISVSAAREFYGVAVSPDGVIDEAETARLRTRLAAE
jgi:hypothetical protein